MRSQARQQVGVKAAQIAAEHQASVERSRAAARVLARPVNFAANAFMAVWAILKAVVRP